MFDFIGFILVLLPLPPLQILFVVVIKSNKPNNI